MRVKELRDLDLALQGELNSTNKQKIYGSVSVLSLFFFKKKRQQLLFLKSENSEIISIIPNDRTKI
jgi:hypothetical protein